MSAREPQSPPDAPLDELTVAADSGDRQARERLFQRLYSELHGIAERAVWRNRGVAALSATTLLHETYLSMSSSAGLQFPDKARFMAYAARAMRSLIIDRVREQGALKRGAGFEFTTLGAAVERADTDPAWLRTLSDALDELARFDPPLAELVDLKYFCGISFAEIAALRGVSERTVQRDWAKARMILREAFSGA